MKSGKAFFFLGSAFYCAIQIFHVLLMSHIIEFGEHSLTENMVFVSYLNGLSVAVMVMGIGLMVLANSNAKKEE